MPAFLTLVVSFSAIAETIPQTNTAVSNFDSISWWVEYAVKQADVVTDPNSKEGVCSILSKIQAIRGDANSAIIFASAISNRQKRIYAHVDAAKTFYKNGNISGYQKSMEQAKSTAMSKGSVESQIFIDSAMIIAYLDCNDVNGARSYT